MKKYIVVGTNNYWYATFDAKEDWEVYSKVEEIKDDIKHKAFDYNGAEELLVYSVELHSEHKTCNYIEPIEADLPGEDINS